MGDLAFFSVKSLGLGVGLKVLEEGKNVVARLFWESSVEEIDLFAHSFS